MVTYETARPVRVFFQEVKGGDIRKYFNESNDASGGGGARDLRIRPEGEFWRPLEPFFPTRISERQRTGCILSVPSEDAPPEGVEVTLMGATSVRPKECRICRIGRIAGWRIEYAELEKAHAAGHSWYYLLILDRSEERRVGKECRSRWSPYH